MATWNIFHSSNDSCCCGRRISPCGTTGLSGYSRYSTLREHPSHQNRGTRLCTADNQSWPQIQTTNALFSNEFWRTDFRWPCRHGRILSELINLQELEKLNPQDDTESRRQFLSHFDWTDSMLQPAEITRIEDLLVEFHDIFARHRFDIGMNEDFKVK